MKEIKEIIKAFDRAQMAGKQTALATVVQVEGSSYRSPGARMLITEDGALTGAISGGCLEGDTLRKAQLVMFKQQSMVVTYDTTDDDDAKFGVGLGCNGIIHILIEPIHNENPLHPIILLKQCLVDRNPKVLMTFYDLENKRSKQIGTCLLWEENRPISGADFLGKLKQNLPGLEELGGLCTTVFRSGHSVVAAGGTNNHLNVFAELIKPPIALIVVGAGND